MRVIIRRVFVSILLAALSLAAKEKKPTGEIPNPAAFAKITSYCIDSSQLSGNDAYTVQGFIETESKPKKLLTKLPWKLYRDCRDAEPDAIVKLEFPLLRNGSVEVSTPADPLNPPDSEYRTKAVLEISDASSSRLLYKVEAWPLDNPLVDSGVEGGDSLPLQRHNAMYNAFSTLIDDVRRAPQPKKK
ncbi:MAG TPA: hypothetical protein VG204_02830 [Terriglobia bacterium]|nr:hypothetical protein [Terriglobia bacterium]